LVGSRRVTDGGLVGLEEERLRARQLHGREQARSKAEIVAERIREDAAEAAREVAARMSESLESDKVSPSKGPVTVSH
jgi:hypothetical protein